MNNFFLNMFFAFDRFSLRFFLLYFFIETNRETLSNRIELVERCPQLSFDAPFDDKKTEKKRTCCLFEREKNREFEFFKGFFIFVYQSSTQIERRRYFSRRTVLGLHFTWTQRGISLFGKKNWIKLFGLSLFQNSSFFFFIRQSLLRKQIESFHRAFRFFILLERTVFRQWRQLMITITITNRMKVHDGIELITLRSFLHRVEATRWILWSICNTIASGRSFTIRTILKD